MNVAVECAGWRSARRHHRVSEGTAGAFAVRCDQATGTVHLLVDVNGYFE